MYQDLAYEDYSMKFAIYVYFCYELKSLSVINPPLPWHNHTSLHQLLEYGVLSIQCHGSLVKVKYRHFPNVVVMPGDYCNVKIEMDG